MRIRQGPSLRSLQFKGNSLSALASQNSGCFTVAGGRVVGRTWGSRGGRVLSPAPVGYALTWQRGLCDMIKDLETGGDPGGCPNHMGS